MEAKLTCTRCGQAHVRDNRGRPVANQWVCKHCGKRMGRYGRKVGFAICYVCHCPFIRLGKGRKVCGSSCQSYVTRQRQKARGVKQSWRNGVSIRQRCEKHGVKCENVVPLMVFRRDNFQCQLCGIATDPCATPSHESYPTIDHIIPVSRGGPHTYDNVQCACRKCNTRKGTKLTYKPTDNTRDVICLRR
jgi:5-methylcytosine-specific restriction endonuclease McrA